ncbi:hypothetical protein Tco_1480244 [Tanacetum coccineum]
MSVRPQTPIPLPFVVEVKRLLALPTPPPSPLTLLSSLLPQIPSPPLPVSSPPLPLPPPTVDSPTYAEAPLGYRAARIMIRASSPPLLLPSSLYFPPPVPTSSPPLPASLCIPPPVDYKDDIPEAELPPCKKLCLTAPTSRFERAERVGYGIRDVWVDPAEAVEEVAPTTLEWVNARVAELAKVQEQDTQNIYAVIEDAQDRQTRLSHRVNILIEDREFHQETMLLMEQEARASREDWAHSVGLSAISLLQRQLSAALGQIRVLQARDLTHVDDPEGADSCA